MRFLLESLNDLNDNLTLHGGCLYMLRGNPVEIFKRIKEEIDLNLITFEQVNCFMLNVLIFKLLICRTVNILDEFVMNW